MPPASAAATLPPWRLRTNHDARFGWNAISSMLNKDNDIKINGART